VRVVFRAGARPAAAEAISVVLHIRLPQELAAVDDEQDRQRERTRREVRRARLLRDPGQPPTCSLGGPTSDLGGILASQSRRHDRRARLPSDNNILSDD
jgi:hypothetical protein